MSLIRSLVAQVRELVESQGGGIVCEIRVQVGPLSGVEPLLMTAAFESCRAEYFPTDARLIVAEVPLEARCRVCRGVFRPVRFCFRCPRCRADDTEVLRGDSVVLASVTLDDSTRGADACVE